MSSGHRTEMRTATISYKELRKASPEAARTAVVEYWKSNGHNVSATARLFGINHCVVYDILRKWAQGDLRNRPKTPRQQPRKTTAQVEEWATRPLLPTSSKNNPQSTTRSVS